MVTLPDEMSVEASGRSGRNGHGGGGTNPDNCGLPDVAHFASLLLMNIILPHYVRTVYFNLIQSEYGKN
jgi:hypothetical protein